MPKTTALSATQDALRNALDRVNARLATPDTGPRHLKPILAPDDVKVLARRPLALDEDAIFPAEPGSLREDLDGLRHLLERRSKVVVEDPIDQIEFDLETLRAVASCLPGETEGVSLYHEARIAAGLAACQATPADAGQPVAYLVGGDLSGIQTFLYTLSSKRAAKTLRGRSFYLQLLTEAVMRMILRELGLSAANVIYSGGGHFYLLVPGAAADTLSRLRSQISETLLRHHGTALYLALAWAPITQADFDQHQTGAAWQAMIAGLRVAKLQRYSELGDALYQQVFALADHGGNTDWLCAVCGEERKFGGAIDDEEAASKIRVCSHCQSLADDIGAKLADAETLTFGLGAPQSQLGPESVLNTLAAFGLFIGMSHWPAERERVWVFTDSPRTAQAHVAHPIHVRRYITTVHLTGELREFSGLIKNNKGIKRLGVLRADVDDAGLRFLEASSATGSTLARLAALSAALGLFFEGWVGKLARDERNATGEAVIYAVYSGGDDLFLIGPWDRMPLLASRIAADFERYSLGRMHLSAGLALIHDKYPVHQAADDAAQALDAAKSQPGKRSFGFLGTVYSWDHFKEVINDFKTIVAIVQADNGNKALLRTLYDLGQGASQGRDPGTGKIVIGPWLWRTVYQLKRYQDSRKVDQSVLDRLRNRIAERDYHGAIDLGVAARWAELLLRKDGQCHDV